MRLRPTPRSADRARSLARVSEKREYFKCRPETIGDFAPKLFQRPNPHAPELLNGLGLSIIQEIMTAHAGTLTITSTPGGGTTVCLSFPEAPRERRVIPEPAM